MSSPGHPEAPYQFKPEPETPDPEHNLGPPWRILIVDDDEDVHRVTSFALSREKILDRSLEFLHARSGKEAIELLGREDELAVVLLDVVMEEEDSGLQVVRHVRDVLRNDTLRIILRTGHPGSAPELEVIQGYDINDYKTKSELTQTRLVTSLTAAIRSYRQIVTISRNKHGLEHIVNASAELLTYSALEQYTEGVLTQISAMMNLDPEGLVCVKQTSDPSLPSDELLIVGAAGRYRGSLNRPLDALGRPEVMEQIQESISRRDHVIRDESSVFFVQGDDAIPAAIYLDTPHVPEDIDLSLLQVFTMNIAAGLANVRLVQRLSHAAYYDELTGLPNKTRFLERTQEGIDGGLDEVIVMVDLDDFSAVNNALGYQTGDRLLQQCADRLERAYSDSAFVARVAGDTFGLIGPAGGIDPDHIARTFAQPFDLDETLFPVRVTCGLVRSLGGRGDALDVFKNANMAMKRAKAMTGTRFLYFSRAMEDETRERMEISNDLRRAITENKLSVVYQPQVKLADGVVGAEALVRWSAPDGTSIPPLKFIPVAESSGLIDDIGRFVLRETCRQASEWRDQPWMPLRFAFNASLRQFNHPNFLDDLKATIDETGVDPTWLEMEITESVVMGDVGHIIGILNEVRAIGVMIAVDDFGTGFSSLGYLQQLPVHRVKIDRVFITEVLENPRSRNIAEMIVNLGRQLGLEVVAEGVESEAQAHFLAEIGCDLAQGYYFGRPVSSADFEASLTPRL